ncbi:ABC transporter permease [Mangrovicoccus ximenensis]|uniref:ABC transporter permease n=1 Tax=Mangrovicoccus ximenensis TaxID=1911570 RepID=UPI000D3C406C|nr:iron chelate uptake ABC transporter family permease subunit [Mangrovicoccus ximenensis]
MSRPLLLTCLALLGLVAASILVGAASMSPVQLLSDPEGLKLLLLSRLPRTAAAMLSGASMAVAGVIMQLLVRNRFVEPGTTGTVEAAMLGLLAVTMLAPGVPILGKMGISAGAALIGMAGFLALIRRLPPEEPLMVPLVGIIYSGIIGAGTTFIAYQADLLQYLGTWMNGEFSGVLAGRYELLWLAGLVAGLAYLFADRFTIAGLGETASIGLGLNYVQTLWIGMITVSVVTAMVVVTVGAVPFVGLVVPNIVARIMGDNLRASLPVMAGMGAGLVLASDVLGRIIRFPYEIPAGTIFGAVGAAVFLWLLLGPKPRAR